MTRSLIAVAIALIILVAAVNYHSRLKPINTYDSSPVVNTYGIMLPKSWWDAASREDTPKGLCINLDGLSSTTPREHYLLFPNLPKDYKTQHYCDILIRMSDHPLP